MKVVDSSGWLEYFAQGPNASFFTPAIQGTDSLVVPAICVYEVFKILLTLRGEEAALLAAGIMSGGTSASLTPEIALQAAHLSLDLKTALADRIILATSKAYEATLYKQDADFEVLDGMAYIEKQSLAKTTIYHSSVKICLIAHPNRNDIYYVSLAGDDP